MTKGLEQGTDVPGAIPDSLICQVDHIARHLHGMFGFGWALDRESAISRAMLKLHYEGGRIDAIQVSVGRAREDVAMAFPEHPQAEHSGFMFMAGWGEISPEQIELLFELVDGRVQRIDLGGAVSDATRRAGISERRYLFKRVWGYLRQGKFGPLIQKSARYVRNNPRLGSSDLIALAARVKGCRCRLMIDHSMGGGANLFRERLVAGWLAAGETVVLLSFRMASMEAYVEVSDRKGIAVSTLGHLDMLAPILESTQLLQIFFNCAVSFPRPQQLQKLLLDISHQSGAELIVAMHEYFLLCPSHFLLDNTGTYCGVPSISQCNTCLGVHDDGFVSLTGERSVESWRAMWAKLFDIASEVRCFSESTRRLLERAYPGMAGRATLCPHEVEPLRPVRNTRLEQPRLTIGVIGAISHHKGAGVVADLARAIVAAQVPVRIVVIGSLDASCPPEVVKLVGPYNQDELPEIVEKHKVNIALLPSICPETFSFVAHEIISMKLPLMCLDLGAQADLVRNQPVGRVSLCQDGPGLLDEIIAFDRYLHPLSLKVVS